MRLSIVTSTNAKQFYAIKSYTNEANKRTSKIVEKLGNELEVLKKSNGKDPIEWAKEYIRNLNEEVKLGTANILINKSPITLIEKNHQNSFNGGYLFLDS